MTGNGSGRAVKRARLILLALWLTAMAAFVIRAAQTGVRLEATAAAAVVVGALIAFYLALADSAFLSALSRALRPGARSLLGALAIFALPVAYGATTRQLSARDGILLLLYPSLSWVLVAWDTRLRPENPKLSLQIALAIVVLWGPLEFDLLPRVLSPSGGPLNLVPVCGLLLGLFLFLLVRALPGMGFTADLRRSDFRQVAVLFSTFLVFFAIPIGIPLHFARSTPKTPVLWEWPLTALAILLLTALPEEVLFRGILQNLFERSLPRHPRLSLALAAFIFGLSHLDNPNPPFLPLVLWGRRFLVPWLYVVLATIAGVFYGLAYRRTGKLTVGALVHTLVDSWWVLFFRG